jgi:hypothetical protein
MKGLKVTFWYWKVSTKRRILQESFTSLGLMIRRIVSNLEEDMNQISESMTFLSPDVMQ